MKRQAGFTLIELVMVIVILGILAAFALPRFADLGGEARKATIQGAFGAIQSAASIAHADSLVNNNPSSISMEGSTVNMVNGYPAVDDTTPGTDDIIVAAQISSNDFTIVDSSNTQVIVRPLSGVTAANVANCQVSYTEAGTGNTPVISIDVSNCD